MATQAVQLVEAFAGHNFSQILWSKGRLTKLGVSRRAWKAIKEYFVHPRRALLHDLQNQNPSLHFWERARKILP